MEIQNQKVSQVQADAVEKKQTWDRFQSQYGEKPKAQRQVKKTLDKDDFLKIMITQMKNQNPTEPFAADKLAQEIAQITSVEQLSNVNKALEGLAKKNDPLERMTMTHLIGKTVTIDPNRFSHVSGFQSQIPYSLSEDAETVKLSVISSRGESVLSQDLGVQKAGKNSYLWNGIKENTLPAESDVYTVKIDAFTKEGKQIPITQSQKTKIIGVSFSGNEPSFVVGDAKNNSKVPMKNIMQIEEEASFDEKVAPASEKNINPLPISMEGEKPENVFQMAAQNPALTKSKAPEMPPAVVERGFPSGLSQPKEKGSVE